MSEMTYRQAGDYQIPNLQLENEGEKPLGKYGRMRRAFLEQNNPMLLNDMILTESLFPHLWEIEETAKARVEFLMEQYLKDSPAPDKETQQKADIEELKDLFGDEFVDFNLVFCSSNGKPIEGQVINRAFNKLIEEKGLPKVVFHSLRHSSITYKLKLNGGDMKSVQGDSGHAQVKMVADVYSHIIDDDRRLNAERMEAAFYSGRQATPEPVQPAATESSADDKELLLKLLQNPEMAALLKSLAKTL